MPRLTLNFEEVRSIRSQISALPVVAEDEAKAQGATRITSSYATRILGQCEMLLRAAAGENGKAVFVKTKNGIAIWRRPS